MNSRACFLLVGFLMELAYLAFYLTDDPTLDVVTLVAVNGICYLLLALVVFLHRRGFRGDTAVSYDPMTIGLIVGFAILFRISLVGHDPVGSDDIYRYIWDGKVAAAGFNPFLLAPSDSALTDLHTETIPSSINFPDMRTIYPPAAQGFFRLSYALFPDSVPGMKSLLVTADLMSIILLLLLLKSKGSDLRSVALYAWSPLPVLYLALDGHIDGLGILLMLAGLLLLVMKRPLVSALALGAAGLAKLYPIFLIPFFSRAASGWKRGVYPVLTGAVVVAGYLLYLEPTGGISESLFVYSTTFEFNGAIYPILKSLAGSAYAGHILSGIMFVLWVLFLFMLKRPLIESVLYAFAGFLLLSPTAHPWYFTWIAALLALHWSLPLFVLLGLTNLGNLVVYQYRTTGIWEDQPALIALQYVPFGILVIFELVRSRTSGSGRGRA